MAGSNALARGVPRKIMQGDGPSVPVISASQIPTIQYSTGNAKALQEFSRTLFGLSSQLEDQLDQRAEAEGQSAGALAGVSGDFELQDYGTIRGRSFNRAAVESFAATIDTQSIVKLNELQSKFANDPAGLQREWTDWRSGMASELAKVSPQQAAAFENRNVVRGISAVEQAKDAAYAMTRSQADAALIENEAALRSEIKTFASDLFSENPERSRAAAQAIGQVQQDFMRIYGATDPNTGRPLYSPEEQAKAKKSFTDMAMTQATLSWFDEQPDKAGAYLKLMSGEFKFNVKSSNDHVKIVMNNAGAKRNDPLKPDIANKMKAAAAATGVDIVVHSGGQETAEEIALTGQGRRTGSVRHDHGGAGDLRLMRNGKVLPFAENRDVYLKFAENAAAAGLTGIGVDEQAGYIHAGGGSEAAWGYRGNSASRRHLSQDFAEAIDRGRGQVLDVEPKTQELPIVETLSASALESLDSEMRSRITFMNSMTDRQSAQEKAVREAQQEKSAFDFSTRLYAAGSQDPATGEPIRPLTREEVVRATRVGSLKPSDGEAILKAMATPTPEASDPGTYRGLLAKVYDGEDIYTDVISSGAKLSSSDARELLSLNASQVRGKQGEFNDDQKFYFNTLTDRLGQTGLFDKFDQGKADRKAQALHEYRTRVLDPNNQDSPATIADDIAKRATNELASSAMSKLSSMVMPRFSVQVPGQYRIDATASKQALQAAFDAGEITESQFRAEAARLVEWYEMQLAIDQAATAPGKKQ